MFVYISPVYMSKTILNRGSFISQMIIPLSSVNFGLDWQGGSGKENI